MRMVVLLTVAMSGLAPGDDVQRSTSTAPGRDRMDPRIPAAVAAKYRDIRDAKEWLNPILTIRAEGVEVVSRGLQGGRKTVAAADLRTLIIALPVADWPYGRVVMASDVGIRRGDRSDDLSIQRNHDAVDRILKALGVTVEWWPSADPRPESTRPNQRLQPTAADAIMRPPRLKRRREAHR
jgi:hypothetical protein